MSEMRMLMGIVLYALGAVFNERILCAAQDQGEGERKG